MTREKKGSVRSYVLNIDPQVIVSVRSQPQGAQAFKDEKFRIPSRAFRESPNHYRYQRSSIVSFILCI